MAGRGSKGRGGNNAGRGARGGRGGVRTRSTKIGLNKELEANIFDLGERLLADLMRTTQIKIAQYIGSLYSGDIMEDLETKKKFIAPTPEYLPTRLRGNDTSPTKERPCTTEEERGTSTPTDTQRYHQQQNQ